MKNNRLIACLAITVILFICSSVFFAGLGEAVKTEDSEASRILYQRAMLELQENNWQGAQSIFESLGDYEDSVRKAYLASVGSVAQMRYAGQNACVFTYQDLQGVVDFSGNTITPARWESIDDFEENGLAMAVRNGKYGFIRPDGTEIIPCSFDAVGEWIESRCAVMLKGQDENRYGVVLEDGTVLIDPVWTSLGSIEWEDVRTDPFLSVSKAFVKHYDGWWVLMNRGGEILTKERYLEYLPFSEGLAAVRGMNYLCGYVDENGNETIPCRYENAASFNEGRAAVKHKNYWGFIDAQGTQCTGFIFSKVTDFSDNMAGVYLEDHGWEIIGSMGEQVYFAGEEHLAADSLMAQGLWAEAIEMYQQLPDDALAQARMKQAYYYLAVEKQSQDEELALSLYRQAGDYWDAQEQADKLQKKLDDLAAKRQAYADADELEAQDKLEQALSMFEKLGTFEDSAARAANIRNKIVERDRLAAEKQAERERLAAEKQKEDMYAAAEQMEKDGLLYDARAAFQSLGDYRDSMERAASIDQKKADYQGAMKLVTAGKWQEAQQAFETLGDYEDSPRKAYLASVGTLEQMTYKGQNTAVFSLHSAYGVVDFAENTVSPAMWDSIGDFDKYGLAQMSLDGKRGLLDRCGRVLLPAEWSSIQEFDRHGLAVAFKNKKCGLINTEARVVLAPEWQSITAFDSNGLAKGAKDGKIGLINTKAQIVLAPTYASIGDFDRYHLAQVRAVGTGNIGLIDLSGKVVANTEYSMIASFDASGLARATKAGKIGWLNTEGRLVVPCQYSAVGNWNNGRSAVCVKNGSTVLFGLVDSNGTEVVSPEWLQLGGLKENSLNTDPFGTNAQMFAENANRKWALLSRDGRKLTDTVYTEVNSFSCGLASVRNEKNLYGFVNQAGEEVIPCQYDDASGFTNGWAAVKRGNAWGYIDLNGKAQTAFIFERYSLFNGSTVHVKVLNEGYEILNNRGEKTYFASEAYQAADALMSAGKWQEAIAAYEAIPDDALAAARVKEAWYRIGDAHMAKEEWTDAAEAFKKAADFDDAPVRYGDAVIKNGSDDEAISYMETITNNRRVQERLHQLYYIRAEKKLSEGNLPDAIQDFISAVDYMDAPQKVQSTWYLLAEEQLQNMEWEDSSESFKKAGNYSDAAARVLEPFYKAGESALAAMNWEAAHNWFVRAENYSDAKTRVPDTYYQAGKAYAAKKDWENARNYFLKVADYLDAKTQADNATIQYAAKLTKQKDYTKAYNMYKSLWGNKNAREAVQKNKELKALSDKWHKARKAGTKLTFGNYEQDINKEGKEGISWFILARNKNKALVISEYVLDYLEFGSSSSSTWDNSSIRKWLNNTFFANALTAQQKAIVYQTNVTADSTPVKKSYWYSNGYYYDYNTYTNQGSDTKDKVFLLSAKEVNSYSNILNVTSATPYARAKGATGMWMTRTKGDTNSTYSSRNNYLRTVTSSVSSDQEYLDSAKKFGVRPAMWINLDMIP